ncbi:phosphatase 2C-like domain-containing protein [Mycena rebaudengoi]|nr:phosphatase 2C-like domain-containing protein [Mycena rebaudengoi]
MSQQITHEAVQIINGSGIGSVQISSIQYQPTDRPIEDRFSITFDSERLIVGVYDGHGGSETAEHISKTLPLELLENPPQEHARIFETTDKRMLDAFKDDHALFRSPSKDWRHHAQVLRSGCTALILDLDLPGMLAYYANSGDCRALVFEASEPLRTLQQTADLNAKTLSEQERIKSEHPNEELLIVSGRLFGKLMSTRGFGDGYYKLPRGINNRRHKKYIDVLSSLERGTGKVPLNAQYESYFYGYRTPPYLTATPDVGSMKITPESIIVCGSDGLFDLVTSQEVGRAIQKGITDGAKNLAAHVLNTVMERKAPGDDVTILVLRFL